jgi:hypothetical protein
MNLENWTDVLRDPKKVHEVVEKEDIVVARRGRSPIRITTDERSHAAAEGYDVAARILAELAPRMAQQLPEVFAHQFPWVRFLPDAEKLQFAKEFVDMTVACASIGNTRPLRELVEDWRRTATVHADPELAKELARPLPGTTKRVPRPSVRAKKR